MRKYVAFLLCFVMIVSLFSCELNKDQDTPSQNENTSSESVENDDTNNTPTQISEAEKAMQMYESAIKGEICVFDEVLGEVKLEDCRFLSNNLRLGECEILNKAILDMDGDGINEYVIQSPNKDHIVLHYYNGKVYSYCFDKSDFYNLNTDGSFYWSDSYESENWTHGLNQIMFDGESLNIKEIYRIKHIAPFDFYENLEFYVDGKQITRVEFLDYRNFGTLVIFSPLDISCEYPISSEKACELASNYWEIENGMSEGVAGTRILHKIVILEKPNSDTQGYRISWQWEGYRNHVPDPPYSLPPENVIIHKELFVDAITGECREYTDNERAMQMYGAAIKGEIYVFDEALGEVKLKDCTFQSNNLKLDSYETLSKAILDIDQDGINEYVIQSPDKDHIVLRYYDGKVYSYRFDYKSFYKLNTDGTFYWYSTDSDSTTKAPLTMGLNKITFDGSSAVVQEIYKLKNIFEYAEEYYLDGRQVTREEYLDYYNYNHKTWAQFSPFEFSCPYPITAEQAWNIADDYLGNVDGHYHCAAGTTIVYKVVVTEKPTKDTEYYRVVLQEFKYCHWIDGWQISNTKSVYELEDLFIDAITGECKPYSSTVPDGKG